MRLTQKKIEEILVGVLGEEGLPLIRSLVGKENVSEFDLASKTKKDIKIIRKMLYILYNHNLVGFTRKKDKQKGWYIYYWTLLQDNVRFNYFKVKRDKLQRLKERLEEERKELFFVCEDKCTRLNFDQAISFDFRCPECGKLASQDSSEDKIKDIKLKVTQLEEELKENLVQKKEIRKSAKQRKKKVLKRKKQVKKLLRKKKQKKR